MGEDALPIIIALGGGAGIGMGLKALVDTILALRAGISANEKKRRTDIVQQRDEALAATIDANRRSARYAQERDAADLNAQIHRQNEQRAREYAADLRLFVMERYGVRREELPDWPHMEATIPRAKLLELLDRQAEQEDQNGTHNEDR